MPTSPKPSVPSAPWHRKISDHLAYALLVYTGLQIALTLGAFQKHGSSLLSYIALALLVVAVLPACRRLEARWKAWDHPNQDQALLARRYRRDRMVVWLAALSLPFAFTGVFKWMAG